MKETKNNLFYALWADLINHEIIKNGGADYWKTFTFFSMSVLGSLNIMACMCAIRLFTGYIITEDTYQYLYTFKSETLNHFLWYLVYLFIPSMIFNYFSVFYRKNYEKILKNYKFRNGKLLKIYCFSSIGMVFFISFLNELFR